MKFVINADDFGISETVNKAITYGFEHDYLDRTTIMVSMPYFEQAVTIAEKYGFKEKVGLHINLTCGLPLTSKIMRVCSFCNKDGMFNGEIYRNKRMMFFLTNDEKEAVKEEICAQIEKYLSNNFTLRHADSHGHIHTFPSMQGVVLDVLKTYSFDSVRISANLHSIGFSTVKKNLLNRSLIDFNKRKGNKYVAFDSFKNVMTNVENIKKDGICEIMLHPNIWDGDMQIGEGLHYSDIVQLERF